MLGEILKGFFVTVSKTGGGGGGGIKISWVENFLKINKWGGTSIRDLRVINDELHSIFCDTQQTSLKINKTTKKLLEKGK